MTNFKCSVCGTLHATASNLKMHAMIHACEKATPHCEMVNVKAPCEVVGVKVPCETEGVKATSEAVSVKAPYETALSATQPCEAQGGKTHKCDVCGVTFPRGSSLARHLAIHTGEKPYVCSVCGLRYARKESWRKHTSGTKDNNNGCHVCPQVFQCRTAFKQHVKSHDIFGGTKEQVGLTSGNYLLADAEVNYMTASDRSSSSGKPTHYGCTECRATFTARYKLSWHLFHVHGQVKGTDSKETTPMVPQLAIPDGSFYSSCRYSERPAPFTIPVKQPTESATFMQQQMDSSSAFMPFNQRAPSQRMIPSGQISWTDSTTGLNPNLDQNFVTSAMAYWSRNGEFASEVLGDTARPLPGPSIYDFSDGT